MSGITPSQTVGPFFDYGLTPTGRYPWSDLAGNNLVTPDVAGERIRIEGRVTDGDGEPVNDAMIEIWQADSQGRYAHPRDNRAPNASFKGFGRAGTDADGRYSFETIKPGAVPGPNGGMQAPHILVAYFSARPAHPHIYAHLFLRRGFEQSRSHSGFGAGGSPRDPDREKGNARHPAGLSIRHPRAGRGRDGVFRYLKASAPRQRLEEI